MNVMMNPYVTELCWLNWSRCSCIGEVTVMRNLWGWWWWSAGIMQR